jgi:rhamnosyltransferase
VCQVVALVVTFHPDAAVCSNIGRLAAQVRHVVIVDNSATAEAAALLRSTFGAQPERFTLLFHGENLGIGAALNRGMQVPAAQSVEWVLTMDQDSQVTDGMVAAMLAAHQALPEPLRTQAVSLAPRLVAGAARGPDAPGAAAGTALPCREIPSAITSGNLVRRSAWAAVGGYDEKLFIDYVDHDFSFRLRRAGWRILECPQACLVHGFGQPTYIRWLGYRMSVDQHAPLRFYYMARNGFYFWSVYREDAAFRRADRINTWKLLVKAALFDTRRGERLRLFWRGYCDYRRRRFGCYTALHPPGRDAGSR